MLWECCIVRVEGGERSLWGFGEKGDDFVLWRGFVLCYGSGGGCIILRVNEHWFALWERKVCCTVLWSGVVGYC